MSTKTLSQELLAVRKLADRIEQWDQDWAKQSINERAAFCRKVGAYEDWNWKAMTDGEAHWLASRLIATGVVGPHSRRARSR